MSWEWDKNVFSYYIGNQYNPKKLIRLSDPENDCKGGYNTSPEKFLRLKDDSGSIVKVPMMSVETLNPKSTHHWARPYMNSEMIVNLDGKQYRPMSNMAGLSTNIEVNHRINTENYGANPTMKLWITGKGISCSVKLPVNLYIKYYIKIIADGKTYSNSIYQTLTKGTVQAGTLGTIYCCSHSNYNSCSIYWSVNCYTDTWQGKSFNKFIDSGTAAFNGYLDFDLD